MDRTTPLLLLTKIVLAFVALNAWAGAVALLVLPAWAGQNFFWPIQTPINAALLGALYLTGAAAVTFVFFRNQWEPARFFVPVLVTAGMLITAITLVHRDRFAMDTRFWYWVGVYGVAPLLVLILYWLQERKRAKGRPARPVRAATRWLAVLTGLAVVAVGASMIVLPQRFVEVWPWATTPLLVRIFAAWFVAFGAGLLWFLAERDWRNMRLLPTMMVAAVALDLLMVAVHRAEITTVGLPLWLYVGHLVAFALVGLLLHGLQRPRPRNHYELLVAPGMQASRSPRRR